MNVFADRFSSPLGDLFAVVDTSGALVQLDFVAGKERPGSKRELEAHYAERGDELEWKPSALRGVKRALKEYFEGERTRFDFELAPPGTPFQKRVWRELQRIPYGRTESYAGLARRIRRPGAARAVGRANATNPIAVVVPCHRVVGSNGSLTGYAGGCDRKRALLELEGHGV